MTNFSPLLQRGLPPRAAHEVHVRRGDQLEERRRPRRRLHPLPVPRRPRPPGGEGRPAAAAVAHAPRIPAAVPAEPAQRLVLVPGIHAGIGAV